MWNKIDVISCVYILFPTEIKGLYEIQKCYKNVFLLALPINMHIVGSVVESKCRLTFLSLRIMDLLDVYSEVSTMTQFYGFQAKNLAFLYIPKCTVQFVCCLIRTACVRIINNIKPTNFAITFCSWKVGHVYMSNTRGLLKGNLLCIHGPEFLFNNNKKHKE